MTVDHRAALLATVTDGDGATAALRALGHAMAWSVDAVSSASGDELADPGAIELVMALDDALSHVDGLVEHVPALAEVSMAGVPVSEYLEQQAAALAALADQVTVARREYEALRAVEAELRASGDEHEAIQGKLEELRRLQRLADALPDVRAQHESLARRVEARLSPVKEAERALLDTADRAVTLTAEQLADLDERTRELLATVQESELSWAERKRRYDADAAKLRTAREEHEKLAKDRECWLAALREYATVDADLFDRLSAAREQAGDQTRALLAAPPDGTPTEHVRTMLADVQLVLEQVDSTLADALDRYNEITDARRQILPWRDEP